MKVLVIDHLFADDIAARLRADFSDINVFTAYDGNAARNTAATSDVIMTLGMHADETLFSGAKNLKWVQSLGAGVDKFLSLPSLGKLELLTNARGIHGPQVTEITFMYMISLLRDFPRLTRQQDAKSWKRFPGRKLQGRTILIWGLGAIGEEIARLAHAFGMCVHAVTRTPRDYPFIDRYIAPDGLKTAVGAADFLIAVAPATPENVGRLNADIFHAMRADSYLINIGRGSLVVEPDLIDALEAKEIAGAALDVVSAEPLPPDNPLWNMPNTIITPHIAGMIEEYPDQVYPIIKTNMAHFLAGEIDQMINRIDPVKPITRRAH